MREKGLVFLVGDGVEPLDSSPCVAQAGLSVSFSDNFGSLDVFVERLSRLFSSWTSSVFATGNGHRPPFSYRFCVPDNVICLATLVPEENFAVVAQRRAGLPLLERYLVASLKEDYPEAFFGTPALRFGPLDFSLIRSEAIAKTELDVLGAFAEPGLSRLRRI